MSIEQKIKYSKRSHNLLSMLNTKIQMNQRNSYNDDMLAINMKRTDNRRKALAIKNRTDVSLPQSNLEILTSYRITKLFEELDEAIDVFLNSANANPGTGLGIKRKEEVLIISAYNSLITYIKTFARSYNISTDDKLAIIKQFERFVPKFKLVINISKIPNLTEVYTKIIRTIEDKIFDNVYIEGDGGSIVVPSTTTISAIPTTPKARKSTVSSIRKSTLLPTPRQKRLNTPVATSAISSA